MGGGWHSESVATKGGKYAKISILQVSGRWRQTVL